MDGTLPISEYARFAMDGKPYTLSFEPRPDYLHVTLTAESIDLEIAVTYINELMAYLRESGDECVLFIRDTPVMFNRRHYATIASVIVNILPKGIRFAVVDLSPSESLVTKVITDEGKTHPNVNAFRNESDAIAWLMSQ